MRLLIFIVFFSTPPLLSDQPRIIIELGDKAEKEAKAEEEKKQAEEDDKAKEDAKEEEEEEDDKPPIELPSPGQLDINAINSTPHQFAIHTAVTAKDKKDRGIIIENISPKDSMKTLASYFSEPEVEYTFLKSLVVTTIKDDAGNDYQQFLSCQLVPPNKDDEKDDGKEEKDDNGAKKDAAKDDKKDDGKDAKKDAVKEDKKDNGKDAKKDAVKEDKKDNGKEDKKDDKKAKDDAKAADKNKDETPSIKKSLNFYFYIPKNQKHPHCAIYFDTL